MVLLLVLLTGTTIVSFLAGSNGFAMALNRAYSIEAALLASIAVILFGYITIFGRAQDSAQIKPPIVAVPPPDPTEDKIVKPAIAFNLLIFMVLGFAATVAATRDWPTASIWSAGMLLLGGVVGLVFSLPVSVSTMAPPKQSEAGALSQASPVASRTVLTQIAGAVVAALSGAILVNLRDLFNLFKTGAHTLAHDLNGGTVSLSAGLIAYFLALGFIAGLVLPQYFLQRVREALGQIQEDITQDQIQQNGGNQDLKKTKNIDKPIAQENLNPAPIGNPIGSQDGNH